MSAPSQLIIFGGTFDPIHNGHLELANKLFDVFKTKITFIPTGTPPYKAPPKASNHQRLEMLNLVLNNNPKFKIDTRELYADEYWYSHKTLSAIRTEVGNAVPIYFVIGGDSLISLHTWDNWKDLLTLANFVVVPRTEYDLNKMGSNEVIEIFNKHKTEDFSDLNAYCGKFYLLNFTPANVSSTLIRQRVAQNQAISDLVPAAVATYIKQQQLYLNSSFSNSSS